MWNGVRNSTVIIGYETVNFHLHHRRTNPGKIVPGKMVPEKSSPEKSSPEKWSPEKWSPEKESPQNWSPGNSETKNRGVSVEHRGMCVECSDVINL